MSDSTARKANTAAESVAAASASHTPGEWNVGALDKNDQRRVGSDNGRLIATCHHECVGALEIEMEANARLIAAAPELLEALEACLPHLQVYTPHWSATKAAIKKARGE